MTLIHNERTKLTANTFDRASRGPWTKCQPKGDQGLSDTISKSWPGPLAGANLQISL